MSRAFSSPPSFWFSAEMFSRKLNTSTYFSRVGLESCVQYGVIKPVTSSTRFPIS